VLGTIAHPLEVTLKRKKSAIVRNGIPVMEENWKEIWGKFYENYSRSFWFYIYRICGDQHLADDIFQESFYKFLKAKPDIQNEKHMQVYLYRIAYRLFVDRIRRIKVEKKAFEEEQHVYRRNIQKEGPESEIQFSLDMEKTFKKLKPRERMILWLAYVEGCSYEEIAEMTETKENSLKVQLFRAREKLAKILKSRELQGRTAS
jgi:RNA polymerase sigma-70 factor (ECF subfamily)